MTSATEYDASNDQRAALLENLLDTLSPTVLADPNLPDILARMIDEQLPGNGQGPVVQAADAGMSDLMGLNSTAPADLGATGIAPGVDNYDDKLKSERILATADLYYLAVHDRLGVFDVMWKLQELFRAGSLRISNGPGAFGLYRFDKHAILRYGQDERQRAYKRVLGYGRGSPGPNARANLEFHPLFTHFIAETAKFWRDKRVSTVIRERATDPSFGSRATVMRAALDVRSNVKNSSYGYVNVLRIETSQALAEAFRVLEAPDIRAQFGAESAWDTIELVMWQYFGRPVAASAMNRMAVTGREILRWLAEPFVLETDRRAFEASLYLIGDAAEEWISSSEGIRLSRVTPPARNVFVAGPPPGRRGGPRGPVIARGRLPLGRPIG